MNTKEEPWPEANSADPGGRPKTRGHAGLGNAYCETSSVSLDHNTIIPMRELTTATKNQHSADPGNKEVLYPSSAIPTQPGHIYQMYKRHKVF